MRADNMKNLKKDTRNFVLNFIGYFYLRMQKNDGILIGLETILATSIYQSSEAAIIFRIFH